MNLSSYNEAQKCDDGDKEDRNWHRVIDVSDEEEKDVIVVVDCDDGDDSGDNKEGVEVKSGVVPV